jgi:hypothetical protein
MGGPADGAGAANDFPAASRREAEDAGLLRPLAPAAASLADFSAPGVFAPEPRVLSNGFPGVLGVLGWPKAAKAPWPRPKALEAPPAGETRPLGAIPEPNLPSDELSLPNRFKGVVLRPEGLSELVFVERLSLVALKRGVARLDEVVHQQPRRTKRKLTWLGDSIGYP